MPRYKLTIAYDGTDFNGWQKLAAESPDMSGDDAPAAPADTGARPLRTVQDVVERAVREVVREPVELRGASRTDSGVHARAQVGAFTRLDATRGPPEDRLDLAINSRLPEDVQIVDVRRVRDDFDPISHCESKGYRYTLHIGRRPPLWNRRYVHHLHVGLDEDAMRTAAAELIGEHDFGAFTNAGHGRLSTVRTVLGCEVKQLDDPELLAIDVWGTGFLFRMVRIIAGTLVEVGKGKMNAEQVREALRTADRRLAGPTLPPTGLCLEWIRYPKDVETPPEPDPEADAPD